MTSIASRIKYYRKRKGLTQEVVASALGIRTENYAKYESGARVPREDRMVKLAKILDVSFNAIAEGVEREFVDLLNRHAITAVLGDVDGFNAFASDMELSNEAYSVITEFLDKGESKFITHGGDLYTKYMENPSLPALVTFFEIYLSSDDCLVEEHDPVFSDLSVPDVAKWVFCVSVRNYLDTHDTESILQDAEKLSTDFEPLQVFAVKVFVPYLSLLIDTVEFCMNTNIDDFEIAFLHRALTPPDEEESLTNDDDE